MARDLDQDLVQHFQLLAHEQVFDLNLLLGLEVSLLDGARQGEIDSFV